MKSWFREVASLRLVGSLCLPALGLPVLGLALLTVTVPSLPARAAAGRDEHAAPASPDRTGQLIAELGSENFAVRQRASRDLIALSISAQAALEQADTGADAEVRVRARAVLALIRETDFRARLDAFAADFDGSHHQSLPGWEQFAAQLGDTRLSRQLFVEMERSEPELLEALSKGTKPASEVLDARCHVLVDQIMQSQRDMHPSLGTAAALLFVGSTSGVQIDEQLSVQLYSWIIYQPVFQKTAQHGVWSAMLKKLLGQWVVKDTNPAAMAQNLLLAASFELRPEALTLATRAITDEAAPANAKQYAILLLGRFGNKEHVPQLEKLLDDATVCTTLQVNNPPRQVELQIRDVSLAVLLHLTGQNLREYGYTSAQPNQATLFQVASLTFLGPAQRDAALKKWGRWRMDHPEL